VKVNKKKLIRNLTFMPCMFIGKRKSLSVDTMCAWISDLAGFVPNGVLIKWETFGSCVLQEQIMALEQGFRNIKNGQTGFYIWRVEARQLHLIVYIYGSIYVRILFYILLLIVNHALYHFVENANCSSSSRCIWKVFQWGCIHYIRLHRVRSSWWRPYEGK